MYSAARFLTFLLCALTVPIATAQSGGDLKMTYLGAAGWIIDDGNVVVLIDPYITRAKYGGGGHPDDDRPDYERGEVVPSDTELIDTIIDGIGKPVDFILVHHGHFDHLGDVPYIAEKTGARVIGTMTTTMILNAYGIPNDQLYAVGGGEDYQFDAVSIRVLPAIHSALNEKRYHDVRRYDRTTELNAPLRVEQFIEGGSLQFLVRFAHHDVLTMGSMNFLERELEGILPDVLLAGINGSRLGLYNYDERLIEVTGNPPVVIPTHWDNFRLPYSYSQQANIERNLIPFAEKMKTLSPDTRVILPVHLEPIVLGPVH
ncbi:MAG: MBL fold metallo-hydrolase [Rhodothermales bacterium]